MNDGIDILSLALLGKANKSFSGSELDIIKRMVISEKYGIDNYIRKGYNDNVIDSMFDIAKTVVGNKGVAATNTTELFGNLPDNHKWMGGVLAPNGKIYGIPYNSTQVLCIDPETHTTELFGDLSGNYKWRGGVLAPNGKIYGIPYNSSQVLCIDPETHTTELFGNLSGSDKWMGGALAPDGKIYGIPSYSSQVLCIDPETHTTELFGNLSGSDKWIGGALAPNGKIYGIPRNSTQVLCIDPGCPNNFKMETLLSPLTNMDL